jgi:hypothetical protein
MAYSLGQHDQAHDLKILSASTPKTGNTWLRSLLAAIYGLRSITIARQFDADALEQLGAGWIAQQHYRPSPELLVWEHRRGAVFVTTMRHPGDVLVSLYHHVRSLGHGAEFGHLKRLSEDDGTFGEPVRQVVETIFKERKRKETP